MDGSGRHERIYVTVTGLTLRLQDSGADAVDRRFVVTLTGDANTKTLIETADAVAALRMFDETKAVYEDPAYKAAHADLTGRHVDGE